jgi:hypothetical protein
MDSLQHIRSRFQTFERFELKYLLAPQQEEPVRSAIEARMIPDVHGDGNYRIINLYFDSPDHRCYWEHVEGTKYRRKLRIRRYSVQDRIDPHSPVFLEIKQKFDKVTSKRRLNVHYETALDLIATSRDGCQATFPDQLHPSERYFLGEVANFASSYQLEPSCTIDYRRQAFKDPEKKNNLRVTLDSDIRYLRGVNTCGTQELGLPILPAEKVLLEIKVGGSIPFWLAELLAQQKIPIANFSKYKVCMETIERLEVMS